MLLKEKIIIKPGSLPPTELNAGIYAYVGSAMNGLKARLNRHLNPKKKKFWHIDYFLEHAQCIEIWITQKALNECSLVKNIIYNFENAFRAAKNFGSSDCKCHGHLIFFTKDPKTEPIFRNILGFEKVFIYDNQV